ncbi:hypothetical protein WR25_24189 [Diploscapter pachys]|uniref:PPM-type phosphatase domain-containing protein n=1 Tax=Diploscapter pachys TaxID=2018661 RepID=A0A2A2KZ27_9BILA|nr:hypothetical protein WR25_24189 [Diploscapter pachys]
MLRVLEFPVCSSIHPFHSFVPMSAAVRTLCLLLSPLVLCGFPELETIYFLITSLDPLCCVVFTVSSYLYVKRKTNQLKPRISGLNLAHKSMAEQFHFEAPKFIDIGFTDLNKYGEFWRLKHKNFSFCAAQGMRSYMEDRMHYMFDPNHTLSIFGIFDGHGGQFVSEYLEKNFAQSIRKRMIQGETRRRLSNTSTISNDDRVVENFIIKFQYQDVFSGSTLIAAMLEGNRFLSVMNVGDSRAVACDEFGRTFPLSKDHKPCDVSF